jgi:hypothetical protein
VEPGLDRPVLSLDAAQAAAGGDVDHLVMPVMRVLAHHAAGRDGLRAHGEAGAELLPAQDAADEAVGGHGLPEARRLLRADHADLAARLVPLHHATSFASRQR